ncbi:DUF4376 domain-containing protein [Aeromonas caviae]|uniref:DUF4376 domain-containing protein n=1 Tax=Aeromonas caviae TaxID=648 RepID=UPI00388FCE2B
MYKVITNGLVLRLSDMACIPFDEANTDYRDYLAWLAKGNTPAPADAPSVEQIYQEWKAERQQRVDAITVEVDGFIFDGDEVSQNRMARAVTAADQLTDTTPWTLHDNSVVTVTALQLKTACRLAGEAQTAIWNEGRPSLTTPATV